jgi:hypothetical protein
MVLIKTQMPGALFQAFAELAKVRPNPTIRQVRESDDYRKRQAQN